MNYDTATLSSIQSFLEHFFVKLMAVTGHSNRREDMEQCAMRTPISKTAQKVRKDIPWHVEIV